MSNTAEPEAKLDSFIEQRTGKAEALPELTKVPEVRRACWCEWGWCEGVLTCGLHWVEWRRGQCTVKAEANDARYILYALLGLVREFHIADFKATLDSLQVIMQATSKRRTGKAGAGPIAPAVAPPKNTHEQRFPAVCTERPLSLVLLLLQIKAEVPQKKEAPVVVAAPMAPAVAEPPAPRPAPAVVEAPTPAPAPAAVVVEERPKGLQTRPDSPSAAAAAPAAPQGGLLIGGAVATLGVVAAAALANNGSGSDGQAAAAAPAGDAAAAAPPAPEAETASAAVGGAGESANPSAKAE